jgi:hypothetical protein
VHAVNFSTVPDICEICQRLAYVVTVFGMPISVMSSESNAFDVASASVFDDFLMLMLGIVVGDCDDFLLSIVDVDVDE